MRVMAPGFHVGTDDPLRPGERFVEDVESTTGIVVEGDSDACVNVLAAIGAGS